MKKKMIASNGSSGNDGNSLRQQRRDTDSRNQHP